MISTLVVWDADALRAFSITKFKFLFGYVNANQTQLIYPMFLNKQTGGVYTTQKKKKDSSDFKNHDELVIYIWRDLKQLRHTYENEQ